MRIFYARGGARVLLKFSALQRRALCVSFWARQVCAVKYLLILFGDPVFFRSRLHAHILLFFFMWKGRCKEKSSILQSISLVY